MKFMQKLNNLKNKKKGFTLVELIIVIVILAILAAILIPSFMGYVNKANDAQAQVEARAIYLAANTVLVENKYADTSFTAGGANMTATQTLAGIGDISGATITADATTGSIKVVWKTATVGDDGTSSTP